MANEAHLGLLGNGVREWERYRQENPSIRLDLSEANLMGRNLSGGHFIGAQFCGTNLEGADLSETRLDFCDFSGAHLRHANLKGAQLTRAKFQGADLREATLAKTVLDQTSFEKAVLSFADFTGAYLSNANFDKAILQETKFIDLSLESALHLDRCQFLGPNVVDHRTMERSANLPIRFLRGCGLPDTLIEYLPSLIGRPIQFHSCFISYSGSDEDFARRLYADLQDQGVRCWYAPEDMKIGDRFRTRIDEVIHLHQKLLIVLSKESMKSAWVEKEVETAFEKESLTNSTVLFPIRLDSKVLDARHGWAADIKRTRHIGDFENWRDHDSYQKSFSRLIRDLKIAISDL